MATRLEEAIARHAAGKLAEAKQLYLGISQSDPQHAEALHLLGVITGQEGDYARAVELIGRSLALSPGNAASHFDQGIAFKELGQLDSAVACFDRAIALQPNLAMAYYNRASALRDLKLPAEALKDYDEVIRLAPKNAAAHAYRGVALLTLLRPEEALESCNRAVAVDPNLAEGWQARGAILLELRRNEAALADLETAARLNPKLLAVMFLRARALALLGRAAESLAILDRAVAMAPGSADAHLNLGLALESREPRRALDSFEHVRRINPDMDYVDGAILHLKQMLCDWADLDEAVARLTAKIALGKPVASPLTVLAATDDPQAQLKAAQTFVGYRSPPNPALGEIPPRTPGAPIRVGYFSADFRDHAVAHLSVAIFEAHDRSRVHPMGFAFGPKADDAMHQRVKAALQPFVALHDLANTNAARRAREFDLDIAVDLGGLTQFARTGILAARVAPIQVAYLGYLGSMGAPYIEYILADEVLIPEWAREQYSEKVAYLPGYQTTEAARTTAGSPTRESLGVPPDAFAFCCLNNSYKISPSIFDCWLRILGSVPRSVLLLSATNAIAAANLKDEARRCGIDAGRLRFLEPSPRSEYLARLKLLDLFLDTYPYNAGTVANDAVWAGLPMVSLAGRTFAARMAASVLTSAGVPELVTHDEDAYVAKAVELATTPRLLDEMRRRLVRSREESLLFDPARFTRHLESLFEVMVQRHRAGAPPDHLLPPRRP